MQIAEKIQEIIESIDLKPGSEPPTERNLEELFGVNGVTLGEALLLLEKKVQ